MVEHTHLRHVDGKRQVVVLGARSVIVRGFVRRGSTVEECDCAEYRAKHPLTQRLLFDT